MRNLTWQTLRLLKWGLRQLNEPARAEADAVLESQDEFLERFEALTRVKVMAQRLRCHGDYHLGQVLWTGTDVVVIDWEGESMRPLEERRLKGSPLSDVAGMLRSFHTCVYAALSERMEEDWGRFWCGWVSAAFLRDYLAVARPAGFLPATSEEMEILTETRLLESALYQLLRELQLQPDRVWGTLRGTRQLLEQS
jgi:maltose alpha-D-glucosyltransferase/alpha-amylase